MKKNHDYVDNKTLANKHVSLHLHIFTILKKLR